MTKPATLEQLIAIRRKYLDSTVMPDLDLLHALNDAIDAYGKLARLVTAREKYVRDVHDGIKLLNVNVLRAFNDAVDDATLDLMRK